MPREDHMIVVTTPRRARLGRPHPLLVLAAIAVAGALAWRAMRGRRPRAAGVGDATGATTAAEASDVWLALHNDRYAG